MSDCLCVHSAAQEGRMSDNEKQVSHVKVALASLIGTAIEWYDFFCTERRQR